jgi:hypothetical protein
MMLQLGLALLCALAMPARAEAEPWGLAQLMQRFHAVPAARAHFVERRYLALLSEPLKTSGTLAYTAPDKLERVTLTPRRERLVVDGDRLTIDQGPEGQTRTLALSAQPELAAVIESIRGTLAGDPAALERFYTVSLSGDERAWSLRLEPKAASLRKLVSLITITGSAAAIQTIETREGDGDRTEMIILDDPP